MSDRIRVRYCTPRAMFISEGLDQIPEVEVAVGKNLGDVGLGGISRCSRFPNVPRKKTKMQTQNGLAAVMPRDTAMHGKLNCMTGRARSRLGHTVMRGIETGCASAKWHGGDDQRHDLDPRCHGVLII